MEMEQDNKSKRSTMCPFWLPGAHIYVYHSSSLSIPHDEDLAFLYENPKGASIVSIPSDFLGCHDSTSNWLCIVFYRIYFSSSHPHTNKRRKYLSMVRETQGKYNASVLLSIVCTYKFSIGSGSTRAYSSLSLVYLGCPNCDLRAFIPAVASQLSIPI